MDISPLQIEGAWVMTPRHFADARGVFHEWFKHEALAEVVGHRLTFAQANCSVSGAGVIRGIHFADVPPSQAKYVTCFAGAIVDVVVDIRVGSPTFGQWEAVRLDATNGRAVYISEGLGHAFVALEPGSTVSYLCSTPFTPGRERGVSPFDPAIGIDWGIAPERAVVSEKDRVAPSLAEARDQGLLPDHEACLEFRRGLARRS